MSHMDDLYDVGAVSDELAFGKNQSVLLESMLSSWKVDESNRHPDYVLGRASTL